jgi:hypothetical protein
MARTSSLRATTVWLVAGVVVVGWACRTARAQSVGFGASPGRASYRPAAQWNNGPYYTAPHWDPYAPRWSIWTGLVYNDPNAPPYTNWPRGRFTTFYPERSTLYTYQQGFAPFSGFAPWYERTYNFTPTERELAVASGRYFRSSPIPPDPRYLAPAVAEALYAPRTLTVGAVPIPTRPAAALDATKPRVDMPQNPPGNAVPRRASIYRGPAGRGS